METASIGRFFEERGARALAAAADAMQAAREYPAEAGLVAFLRLFAPSPEEMTGGVPWLTAGAARAWLTRLAQDVANVSGYTFARGEFHTDPMREFREAVARSARAVQDAVGPDVAAPVVVPVPPPTREPAPTSEPVKPPRARSPKPKAAPPARSVLDDLLALDREEEAAR